jgi:chromosome segregation ATPase
MSLSRKTSKAEPVAVLQADMARLREEHHAVKDSSASMNNYIQALQPNLEKMRIDVRKLGNELAALKDSCDSERKQRADANAALTTRIERIEEILKGVFHTCAHAFM